MSNGYNNWTIKGNLAANAELRYTQSGTAVLNFRVAVSTYAGKDGQGAAQEHTEWVNCVVWSDRAEGLAKVLSKGDQVLVSGEARTRQYEDKEGQKRSSVELHAREVVLCGSPRGSAEAGQGRARGGHNAAPQNRTRNGGASTEEDWG